MCENVERKNMQAVIMAGGKGTRLTSVTKEQIPKPMVRIGKKPILEYQINTLKENKITDIWIITGPLHEIIEDYFGDGSKWGVRIHYFIEQQAMGTGGALFFLKQELKNDFFLLFGDIFFDIDLKRMIEFHRRRQASITLFAHPNSHPADSDLVILDEEQRVNHILRKNEPRIEYYKNMVNGGIYCFHVCVLDSILKAGYLDLEKELIFPRIQTHQDVFGYISPEYVKDIGTPKRLQTAEEEWESGLVKGKNLGRKQKCIFVDRDGTLNRYVGLLADAEALELEEQVPDAVKLAHKKGYLVIVITNQPVIARNLCSLKELEQIHNRLEVLLGEQGAYVDAIKFCPHHPDKGYPEERTEYKIPCHCRKPEIGLIEEAAAEFHIDLSNSYMIGDTTTDIRTGKNAGLKTVLVQTGVAGRDGKYSDKPDQIARNLLEAVKMME